MYRCVSGGTWPIFAPALTDSAANSRSGRATQNATYQRDIGAVATPLIKYSPRPEIAQHMPVMKPPEAQDFMTGETMRLRCMRWSGSRTENLGKY